MADVKLVILSAFGAGALLILLSIIAIAYLRRRSTGGVRRGLFAGSIVTLVIIIGLGCAGRAGLAAVLHRVPPHLLRQRLLDLRPGGHPDPAVPRPVLGGRRHRHRRAGAPRFPGDADPHLAHAPAPRPARRRARQRVAHAGNSQSAEDTATPDTAMQDPDPATDAPAPEVSTEQPAGIRARFKRLKARKAGAARNPRQGPAARQAQPRTRPNWTESLPGSTPARSRRRRRCPRSRTASTSGTASPGTEWSRRSRRVEERGHHNGRDHEQRHEV